MDFDVQMFIDDWVKNKGQLMIFEKNTVKSPPMWCHVYFVNTSQSLFVVNICYGIHTSCHY